MQIFGKMETMLLRSAVDYRLCLWCACDDPEVPETEIITRTCLWDIVNRNSTLETKGQCNGEFRFTDLENAIYAIAECCGLLVVSLVYLR